MNEHKWRERIVKARTARLCQGYRCQTRRIEPGELYLLCVEYPGHEAGYATHAGRPVRHAYCRHCYPSAFVPATRGWRVETPRGAPRASLPICAEDALQYERDDAIRAGEATRAP